MIDYNDLVNAMAATFEKIPPLLALLAPVDPVVAYVEVNPTRNSVALARYQMQPGTVLIAWLETRFREDETSAWSHVIEIFVRALKGRSDHEIVRELVNGVPIPGDGMPWRFCQVMPFVLPTLITAINRITDEEQIDYTVITTETLETGDYLPDLVGRTGE